jgi:type II secretory pathway component GspD/PulD (secretin)
MAPLSFNLNRTKPMKTIRNLICLAALTAGTSLVSARQDAQPGTATNTPPPAPVSEAATPALPKPAVATPPAALPGEAPAVTPAANPAMPQDGVAADSTPPTTSSGGTNGLLLNFRGASLDTVLNYLSSAAGFIIVLEVRPTGKVDVWSNTPVSKDEAIGLLNTVLKKNGFAAVRNGRVLTIVNRDEIKTRDIPVILNGEPASIPKTDEVVTQIIPVRFVEASQLLKDLQPLVSMNTTMTANESGNTIVITDTQANIHRVAEIVKAIDLGAEDETVMRVFKLHNADPQETADELVNLFPDESKSTSGGSTAPQFGGLRGLFGGGGRGGGFGGFGGMGGGQNGGGNGSGNNSRIKKRNRVIAVADGRTSSVVVSAAKDLMDQIEGVVFALDGNAAKREDVHVLHVQNADVQQVNQVLMDIFESRNGAQANRSGQNNQTSALNQRSTQQNAQNASRTTSNFGSTGGGRGGSIGLQ